MLDAASPAPSSGSSVERDGRAGLLSMEAEVLLSAMTVTGSACVDVAALSGRRDSTTAMMLVSALRERAAGGASSAEESRNLDDEAGLGDALGELACAGPKMLSSTDHLLR